MTERIVPRPEGVALLARINAALESALDDLRRDTSSPIDECEQCLATGEPCARHALYAAVTGRRR